jgi:hypothetical protein
MPTLSVNIILTQVVSNFLKIRVMIETSGKSSADFWVRTPVCDVIALNLTRRSEFNMNAVEIIRPALQWGQKLVKKNVRAAAASGN